MRWIQRWHRRIGIFSALVLLLLTLTGLLLNHSDDFGLNQSKLSRAQASLFYAEQTAPSFGSYLPQGWVYQLENSILLNSQLLQKCETGFVGAMWIARVLYIACENKLHVLDRDLRLIESLDARHAFPAPVSAIAACENLCLKSSDQGWTYDFHAGVFRKIESAVDWHKLKKLPQNISAAAPSAFSWERLLLDIHAARFLGPIGVWVLDFFALLFIILSLSGIYLWWWKDLHNRKK